MINKLIELEKLIGNTKIIKAAINKGRFENKSMFFSKITHKKATIKNEIAIPTPPRRGMSPE